MLKAGQAPELWHPGKRRPQDNGWGFVARIGESTFFAHDRYMMEILAAVIAVAALQNILPQFLTMFMDNTATATGKTLGRWHRITSGTR